MFGQRKSTGHDDTRGEVADGTVSLSRRVVLHLARAPGAAPDRWRLGVYLPLVLGGVLCPLVAHAQTPIAVTTCDPCGNITDLRIAAGKWANVAGGPAGAIILMHSLNIAVSGYFRVVQLPHGGGYGVQAITLTNGDALALDNRIFARGSKAPGLRLSNPYASNDTVIEAGINKDLSLVQAAPLSGPWHGLQGFPVGQYSQFTNNGNTYTFYVNDPVVVNYSDGYSMEWLFTGLQLNSNNQWVAHWRPDLSTLLYKGQPVSPPSTKPAKPVGGFGSASGTNTWSLGPSNLLDKIDYPICAGNSSITVSLGGVSSTSTGWFGFPC